MRTIMGCWHRVLALLIILNAQDINQRREYIRTPLKERHTRKAIQSIETNNTMRETSVDVDINMEIVAINQAEKRAIKKNARAINFD